MVYDDFPCIESYMNGADLFQPIARSVFSRDGDIEKSTISSRYVSDEKAPNVRPPNAGPCFEYVHVKRPTLFESVKALPLSRGGSE
jgi:hypothetical protein